MTNSFLIGEAITNILTSDLSLKSLIENKVYPIVASEGTTFPFVIYKRNNTVSSGCKDGYYEDRVDFVIKVVSERYVEGLEIANRIRTILERPRLVLENMELNETRITNAFEDYQDNVYVQTINFNTKIN